MRFSVHPGIFWDNTAPGRCRMSAIHHWECQRWAGCRGTGMDVGGPKPRGRGLETPLCPQTQHRGRWGAGGKAPSGMGTRAGLAQAEGLQVGRGAPENPSHGTTEGGGSRSPRAGTHSRGASTGPWQTPSLLPALAGAQEPQPSPPAPAGSSAAPAPAGSFLLISCGPGRAQHPGIPAPPLPAPSGPAELPAGAKPRAEEGKQRWGCPCATHP